MIDKYSYKHKYKVDNPMSRTERFTKLHRVGITGTGFYKPHKNK